MNKSFLAKLLGWGAAAGNIAITLAQNGVTIGHYHGTDFISIAATLAMALGIHHASNTSVDNPTGK